MVQKWRVARGRSAPRHPSRRRASPAPDHVHHLACLSKSVSQTRWLSPGASCRMHSRVNRSIYLTISESPGNATWVAHRFVTRKRGILYPRFWFFATGRSAGANGCLCCAVQWLWRWAAVAGHWPAPGPCSWPTPSGPLASRIAVAFPRPGPHEAQCFFLSLSMIPLSAPPTAECHIRPRNWAQIETTALGSRSLGFRERAIAYGRCIQSGMMGAPVEAPPAAQPLSWPLVQSVLINCPPAVTTTPGQSGPHSFLNLGRRRHPRLPFQWLSRGHASHSPAENRLRLLRSCHCRGNNISPHRKPVVIHTGRWRGGGRRVGYAVLPIVSDEAPTPQDCEALDATGRRKSAQQRGGSA